MDGRAPAAAVSASRRRKGTPGFGSPSEKRFKGRGFGAPGGRGVGVGVGHLRRGAPTRGHAAEPGSWGAGLRAGAPAPAGPEAHGVPRGPALGDGLPKTVFLGTGGSGRRRTFGASEAMSFIFPRSRGLAPPSPPDREGLPVSVPVRPRALRRKARRAADSRRQGAGPRRPPY